MNKKHKVLRIILAILLCYAVFAGIVISFYYQIRYDPEDGAATDFLHSSQTLQDEIGEVRYVAKRAFDKEYEDEKGLHITYGVETFEAKYHIQVHFRNESGEWVPFEYTILELSERF